VRYLSVMFPRYVSKDVVRRYSRGTQSNDESKLDRWVWRNIVRQTAPMEDGTSPTALEKTLMNIKLAMRIFCVV